MRRIACLALLLLFLATGCGEVPAAPPGEVPTLVVEQPSAPPAQDSTVGPDQFTVPLPPTVTPIPYPLPTREPFTPRPLSTATPFPEVIVLGAEWAPEAERETYVSTTVVVAKVGDGPGEIGYQTHGEALPSKADRFTVDGYGNIYILDRVNQRVAKFDTQGRFTQNIPYPGREELWYPELIATDMEGRIYLYDGGTNPEMAGVQCYDAQGTLVQKYPSPSWFIDRRILAMYRDKQGTLWVQGEGYSPNAPIIDGQPYSKVAVPLGDATGALNLDEEQQKALAVPGHLLPSGKPMIVYSLTAAGPAFVYDSSGQPIYQVVEGISAIDLAGKMYYIQYKGNGYTIIKWDALGRRIASFELPLGYIHVENDGTVYCFGIDQETQETYYVVRARLKLRLRSSILLFLAM
jgi:hypothetical protein